MKVERPRRAKGGQFAKGASGNPSGRPKRQAQPIRSVFDILYDQKISVAQDGRRHELTVEEAAVQKLYEKALSGDRRAQAKILSMIAEWDECRARRSAKVKVDLPRPLVAAQQWVPEREMRLLDLIEKDVYGRNKIANWLVQSAMKRARRSFNERQLDDIRSNSARPQDIVWPKAMDDE